MIYHYIDKCHLKDGVSLPTSKSWALRLLIVGALSPNPIKICKVPCCNDVEDLLRIFKLIGIIVEETSTSSYEKDILVLNSFPECETSTMPLTLESGEGGAVNRFLLAMLSLGRRQYTLLPSGRMPHRPINQMFSLLEQAGAFASLVKIENRTGYTVAGPWKKDMLHLTVDGSQTGQFASAFILAALNRPDISVEVENLSGSGNYIKLSRHLVDEARKGIASFEVPADMSAAAFIAVFAALSTGGKIVNCMYRDNFQADDIIWDWLHRAQIQTKWSRDGVAIGVNRPPPGLDLDFSSCPDLFPPMSVLLAHADGVSRCMNLKRQRLKESDRLQGVLNLLTQLAIKYEYDEVGDMLMIYGNPEGINRQLDLAVERDHRMVMCAAMFLMLGRGGRLTNINAVAKSFPGFFGLFEECQER